MKNILILLLVTLCGVISAQDEKPKTKLPAEAQSLVDKYNADVAKRTEELEKALTKIQETTTKKGDLTGAMAIKEAIDGLSTKADTDLLGNKLPQGENKDMQGTYSIIAPGWSGEWVISEGGKCSSPGVVGTWSVSTGGKVTLKWETGLVEYLEKNKDDDGKKRKCTLANGAVGIAIKR